VDSNSKVGLRFDGEPLSMNDIGRIESLGGLSKECGSLTPSGYPLFQGVDGQTGNGAIRHRQCESVPDLFALGRNWSAGIKVNFSLVSPRASNDILWRVNKRQFSGRI